MKRGRGHALSMKALTVAQSSRCFIADGCSFCVSDTSAEGVLRKYVIIEPNPPDGEVRYVKLSCHFEREAVLFAALFTKLPYSLPYYRTVSGGHSVRQLPLIF